MQRLGFEECATITSKIKIMEELLLQMPKNSLKNNGAQTVTHTQNYLKSENTPIGKKWCSFHKTPHHSNSECRKQNHRPIRSNQHTKQSNSFNNDSAHLIREPINTLHLLGLDGEMNNNKVKILLDTGSLKNYISETTANRLGITVMKAEAHRNKQVELGNGTSAKIIGISNTDLKLEAFPAFTILSGTLNEVLLGSPLLNRHDVMIDYRAKHIRIIDQVLVFQDTNQADWTENPDSLITERSLHLNEIPSKEQILARISSAERSSSKLGLIPGVKMQIKTETSIIKNHIQFRKA
ncbi:hypothetical protein ENBRE01_2847 [Enteropsectra breve]|nr:hypothetical protein ENBRE01_2847 [Enteropsectra breve]